MELTSKSLKFDKSKCETNLREIDKNRQIDEKISECEKESGMWK